MELILFLVLTDLGRIFLFFCYHFFHFILKCHEPPKLEKFMPEKFNNVSTHNERALVILNLLKMVSIEPYIRQIFYETIFPTGTSYSMICLSSLTLLLHSPTCLCTCTNTTVINNLPLKLQWIYPEADTERRQLFIQDVI